jgi:hypothetical protein
MSFFSRCPHHLSFPQGRSAVDEEALGELEECLELLASLCKSQPALVGDLMGLKVRRGGVREGGEGKRAKEGGFRPGARTHTHTRTQHTTHFLSLTRTPLCGPDLQWWPVLLAGCGGLCCELPVPAALTLTPHTLPLITGGPDLQWWPVLLAGCGGLCCELPVPAAVAGPGRGGAATQGPRCLPGPDGAHCKGAPLPVSRGEEGRGKERMVVVLRWS